MKGFFKNLRDLADEAEAAARRRPAIAQSVLFLWAAALRLALCALVAQAAGLPARDLSFFFDGHLYLLIARTFPKPYAGLHAIFPFYRDSPFLTGWFPLHPLVVYLFHFLVKDLRLAALAACQSVGALAVALFFSLAVEARVSRPLALAALFALFPPTLLLCGSLNFVEPLYACLFIAAFLCFLRGRHGWGAVWVGLTILTQKTGFLILLIFGALALARGGLRALKSLRPYGLALLAPAALQGYLGWLFHDPLANVHAQRSAWGEPFFTFPFRALASGIIHDHDLYPDIYLRKLLILSCLAFYAGAWLVGWWRRDEASRPFLAWLGLFLLFNVSLSGAAGYFSFPRYMTVASPAAWILLGRRLPAWALYAALAAVPAVMAVAAHDALMGIQVTVNFWTAPYFAWLARSLFGG